MLNVRSKFDKARIKKETIDYFAYRFNMIAGKCIKLHFKKDNVKIKLNLY